MSGNRAKDIAPPPPPPENQEKTVKVYFGVFFDGTNNHQGQARIGEKYRTKINSGTTDKEAKKQLAEEGLNYKASAIQLNDQSNVALLKEYYKVNLSENDKYVNIYVEGIGTTEEGDNKIRGSATGTGKTGIEEKVKTALSEIPKKIKSLSIQKDSKVDLYLETFGFSRGAAAARNFVSEVTGEKIPSFKDSLNPYSISNVTVNYVGLFDTVSSHGTDFGDDVEKLSLNAISNAKYVFHICAVDEFRENFALTNIKSAGGKGKEIFMPGAHSDIGGGYAGGEYSTTLKTEKPSGAVNKILDTYITEERLKELGWITDGDKEVKKNYKTTVLGKIDINANIKKGYSFVSLELMKESACEKRPDTFKSISRSYEIPEELKPGSKSKLKMNLKEEVKNFNTLKKCLESVGMEDYKYLRKHWLHFSSNEAAFSIGMSSRRENGILKRQIIDG